MKREELSAVIIALNAEHRLEACLQSIAFADEIVVVDSGSCDGTEALVARYGGRFIRQPWLGFGPQKQFAVEQAVHDWVLCIDADERVSEVLQKDIERVLQAPRCGAYQMARCNRFMGRWLRHGEGYPDYNLRLFHRAQARWSDDAIHEHVVSSGPVATLQGDLLHESEVGIANYLSKQNSYTTLQAQKLFEQGQRASLMRILFSPLLRFIKFYVIRSGWRDGLPGLVHILIGCFNSFIKYAKLAEHSRRSKP